MKYRQSPDCPSLTSGFQPETLGRPDAYCSLCGERVLTYSTQEIYLLSADLPDRLDFCSALDASGLSAGHPLPRLVQSFTWFATPGLST